MTPEQRAARFNARCPIGTLVHYHPIKDEMGFEEARTRSEAWPLGGGHVVVKITGRAGGVHIDHLVLFPENVHTGHSTNGEGTRS